MDAPPFYPGDCMEWVLLSSAEEAPDWTQAQRCYVLDLAYDGLVVEDGRSRPRRARALALRRVIDDVTEIDEPPL